MGEKLRRSWFAERRAALEWKLWFAVLGVLDKTAPTPRQPIHQ
jgi:hypothetical protein